MMSISAQSAMPTSYCPLCSSKSSHILTHQLRRGLGVVNYCASCQHGFLTQDSIVDHKKYYSQLYRTQYSHYAESTSTNPSEIFHVYKNYQHDRIRYVQPYLKSTSRLLEVGASSGQFLYHVKDLVAEVNAVELDNACCDFLVQNLGIDADANFLENSRFAEKTYDVVCAFQVIEHVEDPYLFLKTIQNATKKGGMILIEAPNLRDPLLSTWSVPHYCQFFYHSAHLHYFTENSLIKVALEVGFRLDQIEIIFTQDYNLLNHLHWIMNDAPQPNCHFGLSEINLHGPNHEISGWLSKELRSLNRRYIDKLIAAKSTSNILMRLSND